MLKYKITFIKEKWSYEIKEQWDKEISPSLIKAGFNPVHTINENLPITFLQGDTGYDFVMLPLHVRNWIMERIGEVSTTESFSFEDRDVKTLEGYEPLQTMKMKVPVQFGKWSEHGRMVQILSRTYDKDLMKTTYEFRIAKYQKGAGRKFTADLPFGYHFDKVD